MLSENEKLRYDRQLKLTGIGAEGQIKLKQAAVLVIGAGGLGCPALQYLAAAGIGQIGIVDFDSVHISNLQRQILFQTDDIGENKAEAAKHRLEQLNSLIHIESFTEKLTPKNALQIMSPFDIILDCTDNFATRYLVNDACIILDKPWVYGAIYKYEGQVSVFNYNNGPTYRCLFPDPPKENMPTCEELGVLGVMPGIIGTYQASETLKIILGIGTVLSGKLQLFNTLSSEQTSIQIDRREEVIQKVIKHGKNFRRQDYDAYCARSLKPMREITYNQFIKKLANKSVRILDVREPWERPNIEGEFVINIPLQRIEASLNLIPKADDLIVICQHGIRSRAVVDHLQTNYNFKNLINLEGGVTPNEQK